MGLRLQVLSEADKHLGVLDHPGEKEKQVREGQAGGRQDWTLFWRHV